MGLRERLGLALERLKAEDWKLFEEFASDFLSPDYPNIRTMASPSGDGGRDAELFSSESDPSVVFQYSIAPDWKRKIHDTVQRLTTYFSDHQIKLLIFVSPQEIGAKADALKREIYRDSALILDIYDRNWFLERVNNTDAQILAAERLVEKVIDPIIKEHNLTSIRISGLDDQELQMAHLFLSLQVKDHTQGRNLTKASFESIVLSILRDTDSKNRMPRKEIHEKACAILPDDVPDEVIMYVDRALERLTKKSVRHWAKHDEFCLSYEEKQRLAGEIASREALHKEILSKLVSQFQADDALAPFANQLSENTLIILEDYLRKRSEAFCICIADGRSVSLSYDDLRCVITERLSVSKELQELASSVQNLFEILGAALDWILRTTDSKIQSFLRSRANAYIILSFLKRTPNIRKLCQKILKGDIWLDTCILLPLLAETLQDEEDRRYTRVLRNAVQSGMKLFVTAGVLEEVLAHINRCITYSRYDSTKWQGNIPFLYEAYCESGEASMSFDEWIYMFCGKDDFQGNLSEFLADEFSITVAQPSSLDNEEFEYRYRLHEYWCTLHEKRICRKGIEPETSLVQRLADHDVENYLGVLSRRNKEAQTPLGYKTWWLTLDLAAYRAPKILEAENPSWKHLSPAMSLDFLANYVSFSSSAHSLDNIPVLSDLIYQPFVTPEILEEATRIRNELAGKPPQYIKRKIRDVIHTLRQKLGFHGQNIFEVVKKRTSEEDFDLEDL